MKKNLYFYNIFVWFIILLDENVRLLVVFWICVEDFFKCE